MTVFQKDLLLNFLADTDFLQIEISLLELAPGFVDLPLAFDDLVDSILSLEQKLLLLTLASTALSRNKPDIDALAFSSLYLPRNLIYSVHTILLLLDEILSQTIPVITHQQLLTRLHLLTLLAKPELYCMFV